MKDSMEGARGRIDAAQTAVPKERVGTGRNVGSAGQERKADVKGAMEGGSMAEGGGTVRVPLPSELKK